MSQKRRSPLPLEVARQHQGPIHLLLTDVVMPGMNGATLAEKLAASRPETKVLYMSGYADHALGQNEILDCGTSLLEKPFTRDSLTRKVRAVLNLERASIPREQKTNLATESK